VFTGSSTDAEDGNLTGSVQWTDNGTSIGSGGSLTRILTAGSHTVVARVTDSGGLQASRQVTVTVTTAPTNTAPSVSIATPSNGISIVQGTSLVFTGSSTDAEDGNLTGSVQWTDNGTSMGSGGSLSRVLTLGSHSVVARVTDSGGLQASRQVTVTVTSSTGGSTPTLSARGRKVKGVPNTDLSWNGLSGTSIDVYRNNVKVMGTANDGAETDRINSKGSATYTYKVCAVGTTTCSNTASVVF
jgi:hypothetical protein